MAATTDRGDGSWALGWRRRAEAAAFKFAQDQVGVGHPDPDAHDAPPSKAIVRGQAPKR